MWNESQPDKLLTRYLLGELSPRERDELEDRYFSDEAFHDQLLATEAELIDSYVRDELSTKRRVRFERWFLQSPERVEKLEFAQALARVNSAAPRIEFSRGTSSSQLLLSSIFARLKEHVSFARPSFALSAGFAICSLAALWIHMVVMQMQTASVVQKPTGASENQVQVAEQMLPGAPPPNPSPVEAGRGRAMSKTTDVTQKIDQAREVQQLREAMQQAEMARLARDKANNQVLLKQQPTTTTPTGLSLNANSVSSSRFEALLAEGRQKLDKGQASVALDLANNLISMYPARWEAWELAAQSATKLGDFTLTEKMYERALSVAPAEARPNVEQEINRFRRVGLGALVLILRGKVTMADGSPPPKSVGIERVCSDNSGSAPGPPTDKTGEYVWRMEVDSIRTRSCSLRATLSGYTSTSIGISYAYSNVDLPALVLTPIVTAR